MAVISRHRLRATIGNNNNTEMRIDTRRTIWPARTAADGGLLLKKLRRSRRMAVIVRRRLRAAIRNITEKGSILAAQQRPALLTVDRALLRVWFNWNEAHPGIPHCLKNKPVSAASAADTRNRRLSGRHLSWRWR